MSSVSKENVKGYLISGLGPGTSGLGRFLRRLAASAEHRGWTVICRPSSREQGIFRFALNTAWFYMRLMLIREAEVILLHPQTLRWRWFFRLAGSNRTKLYVVDNSFFCIRSYNYRGPGWGECLDCLGDASRCHTSCRPFPVFYERTANLAYLKQLKKDAARITFLVQNSKQGLLVARHFGTETKVRVVGMVTDEFEQVKRGDPGTGRYDIVYHGALIEAKGASYAIELAKRLPDLSVLLPGIRREAEVMAGDAGLPANITVEDITWETGLRDRVRNCGLVLCPSMWSAPIEGALVKSILHNGRVAVFDTAYGYQADLPENLVIRLGPDVEQAAEKIRDGLLSEPDDDCIKRWIEGMLAGTDLDSIFA